MIKIGDFSVSLSLTSADAEAQLKKTVGTPAFLPPELCASETLRIVGPVIDVWGLGVTLFYFIYGRLPFIGDTEVQLYDNIRTQELKFPHAVDIGKLLLITPRSRSHFG